MTPPMTHHSEPAREAVALLLAGLSDFDHMMACHVGIGYFDGAEITKEWDHLVRPAMGRLKAELAKPRPATSPAPAAGGLEAVREALRLAEGRLELLLREFPDESATSDHPVATRYVLSKVKAEIAALASPAATSEEDEINAQRALAHEEIANDVLGWLTARGLYDPRDYEHEGPNVADILTEHEEDLLRPRDQRTPEEILVALTQPAPAATSAETQGGDGVREGRWFDPYILKAMAENYAGGHCWDHIDGQACLEALALIENLQAQLAALAPSTSAATRGEPVGAEPELWSPKLEAIRLLAAEDKRQLQILDLLETIREQIRLGVKPEHRPEGLMKNMQNAVYALRGRLALLNDAAIMAPLRAPPAPAVESAQVKVKPLVWREYEHEGDPDQWDAHTIFGTYYGIRIRIEGYVLTHDFVRICAAETLDEAKTAAQADYEARIRASLDLATDAEG